MLFTSVAPAFAQGAGGGGGGGGAYGNVQATCQMIRQQVEGSDIDKAWLTEYIVTCVKTVVLQAFIQFVVQFYTIMHQIIMAAMTLAVTLFGVLILTGMIEKSARDSFVGLFKFGCVLFFVRPDTVTQIFDMGMNSMDGLTDIVFQFGKGGSGRCYDNATLWDRIDCMLDLLIGIVKSGGPGGAGAGGGGGAAAAGGLQGISRGSMHFMMSSIAGSGLGALIGMLGFYTVYTILMATIKSIHTYLAAIIALAFILVLAPMFVPLIMFKATRTYFDKWHRIATSFVLQPVILFGFISLMMIALEDMLVGEQNQGAYYRVACGPQCLQKDQFMSQVLTQSGAICTGCNFTGVGDKRGGSGINLAHDMKKGKYTKRNTGAFGNYMLNQQSGGQQQAPKSIFGTGARFDQWNPEKTPGAASETTQQEKMALSAIALALTAFVFISMLNYIPNLATDLAGGLYEVPNLFKTVGEHLPGGKQLEEATKHLSDKFNMFAGGRR